MGKAKRRSLNLGINNQFSNMTREEAVNDIVKNIEDKEFVIKLISLFGIQAEELLEAGATYEDVIAFRGIL